ncbi:MAG TPA: M20/M25/M40 family metallo-hydrolase [Pyrinomonadaceae bacterium]|nr:M20/M25/M40 family metallo-hydrolase [Pyrinomonadaceae bacterium]
MRPEIKRRKLLSLSLILIFALSALAQQIRVAQSTPDAASVERLRSHITYLASDALEGRRTGTEGANKAADYIAREFKRYKLLPSVLDAEQGQNYYQNFPFVAGVELGTGNSMLFTPSAAASDAAMGARASSLDLRLQEDWMPLGFSLNGRVENLPAMFAGYGITASELNYDDYAGVDMNGRIAIALADTPDGDNPHGQFARYADVRWKAIAAREHGARALIVIASEENFRDERLAHLTYDNSAGNAGLPVAVISRQAAQRILTAGGLAPLTDLEKAARERASSTSSTATGSATQAHRPITLSLQNITLTIATDIARREVPAMNVVGILEGSDPQLKSEAIVIGAHYDHLGRGGQGSLAPREGDIHHGADDNASGVAGLLELARIFSAQRIKIKRTLVFIAFSGEEEGLLGSSFYVNHPVVPLERTIAMINMDMIGRMRDNKLIIGGVGTAKEWREWIEGANTAQGINVTATATPESRGQRQPTNGVPIVVSANGSTIVSLNGNSFALTLNEDGYGPSDHSSFYAKKIPVLFFWTGNHDDYHKPSDTVDRINFTDEARIVSFVASIIRSVDAGQQRPTYTVARSESTGRTMGFRVYLGTIPNYSDSNDGLLLDGVRDDSPAARAGLKAGDRIVRLAGREVHNVYDYTYALGEMKAGQEYEMEIVRGSEHLKLKIIPAARRQ